MMSTENAGVGSANALAQTPDNGKSGKKGKKNGARTPLADMEPAQIPDEQGAVPLTSAETALELDGFAETRKKLLEGAGASVTSLTSRSSIMSLPKLPGVSVEGDGGDEDDEEEEEEEEENMAKKQLSASVPAAPVEYSAHELDSFAHTLFSGAQFIKFGRMGAPKPKLVMCSQDGSIFYCDAGKKSTKSLTSMRLVSVTAVEAGKKTSVFKQRAAQDVSEAVCFSIVFPDRTLDLQCASEEMRDHWVAALRYAVDNVQRLGKVTRQPMSTTEQERKMVETQKQVQALREQLERVQQVEAKQRKELDARKKELEDMIEQSRKSVAEKEKELADAQVESERLKKRQDELEREIKRVHHERQASRVLRQSNLARMEGEIERLQQIRKEQEEKAAAEKAQMTKIISDSQKLLAKAKETLHKRQQSRAQRTAMIEALQREADELRTRNMELRREAASAKTIEAKAKKEIERARSIVTAVAKAEDIAFPDGSGGERAAAAAAAGGEFAIGTPEEDAMLAASAHMEVVREEDDAALAALNKSDSVHSRSDSVERTNGAPFPAVGGGGFSLSYAEVLQPARWQPDSASENCTLCRCEFGFFTRRHHCRKCGHLVCDDCSKARVPVRETKDKVRVCESCVKCL